jgi:hypothetical protein
LEVPVTSPTPDHWQIQDAKHLTGILLGGPKLDAAAGAFAEVEAERKAGFGRATDLAAGW